MINKDFFYKKVEVDIIERFPSYQILNTKKRNLGTYTDFHLFEIKEKEFRKSDMLYYSRILTYRIMGILKKDISLYSQFFPYDCSNCFSRMTDKTICNECNKKYTENDYYFININNLFNSIQYSKLKNKFNLGYVSEVYRDQRTSISTFMKEEIVKKALHPDRISKILELSNDSWINIDNYI